jgi:hypothetical protein
MCGMLIRSQFTNCLSAWRLEDLHRAGIQLQSMVSLSAQNLFLLENGALKVDSSCVERRSKSRYQLGKFHHHNESWKDSTQCFEYWNMLPSIFDYIVKVGARFSPSAQTGPGDHTASYTIGTGSFPGVKRQGRGVDHAPHLAPRLRKV